MMDEDRQRELEKRIEDIDRQLVFESVPSAAAGDLPATLGSATPEKIETIHLLVRRKSDIQAQLIMGRSTD